MKRKKRPPLTPKRQQWADERGGVSFRGKPLTAPVAPAARLAGSLNHMIEEMHKTTLRELRAAFREPEAPGAGMDASFASSVSRVLTKMREKFMGIFSARSLKLAEYLNRSVSAASASQLRESLKEVSGGLTLKTDVISGPVAEVMKAGVKEGVALIKSIPDKYFLDIEGAVMRSIQSGRGMADLQPFIERLGHSTKKRAALIARDQTSKATTALNRARMEALGVRQFEWLHSGGGKEPRELHIALSGRIFSFDDPPVIDERTGERGFPGQLINCRCRMGPVISFGEPE